MVGSRSIAIASFCLAPSLACAQAIDLAAVYGNETGCKVLAGGSYTSDDKFLLRPSGYEAHESGCEFVAVHSTRDGAQLATALCQGEGTYWSQSLIVTPPDPESESLLVFFDNGELWHEVRPCR